MCVCVCVLSHCDRACAMKHAPGILLHRASHSKTEVGRCSLCCLLHSLLEKSLFPEGWFF